MYSKRKGFSSRLKHYVEFWENISESELAAENWVKQHECFVELTPIYDTKPHSIEDFSFGHLVTEKYYSISARFNPDLHDKMRIHYNDRVFAVKRIINVKERSRYMYMIVQEE